MRCSQTYIINVEGRKRESERERKKRREGGRKEGRRINSQGTQGCMTEKETKFSCLNVLNWGPAGSKMCVHC